MQRLLVLTGLLALTGCASIAGEKMQPVSILTTHDNKEMAGVNCTLSNDVGSWSLTSPATVTVHKSTGDLVVDCRKDAFAGNAVLVSKSNGAVWGNILLGGGVGYIVDRNTGAGFDYPASMTVSLRSLADPMPGVASPAAPLVAPQANAGHIQAD
jgi:hypothetical protein